MTEPTTDPSSTSEDAPVTPPVRRRDIDEVIQHTDSGSGSSQGEHWRPNVSIPDETAPGT